MRAVCLAQAIRSIQDGYLAEAVRLVQGVS